MCPKCTLSLYVQYQVLIFLCFSFDIPQVTQAHNHVMEKTLAILDAKCLFVYFFFVLYCIYHLGANAFFFLQSSENKEVFTPKILKGNDKDQQKNVYRFECPYAGQFRCSLTSLVFVMEGKGEVLYKTVSWDPRLLDGLGKMEPAGPLYDIDCFDGAISGLHLPHCEIFSEKDMDGLAVAHVTDGNLAKMDPLKVTEAHVMIDIKHLSFFGLIKRILFPPRPVNAQVLVFQRPVTERQRENVLGVHLLPSNVPLTEVKDQHAENMDIKATSQFRLTPETDYRLCCQAETFTVQPETKVFELHFSPNCHPTFEVFVNVRNKEVKLSLMDNTERREVWSTQQILLTVTSGQEVDRPAHRQLTESEFVDKNRHLLIQRVSSVMAIADCLRTKNMITGEMYRKVLAKESCPDKTRLLLVALDSGGASVKAEFYRLLKENEPHLVDDLDSEASRPQ
ncbi:NACHT, LRR and PYD domains-containing protein 1-like [Garra rufa]|uniref:NACHT, LRR and PYD domains-containing protein 1-like n=1 Tax=Garra rufa TaxID=137080 RepID=UPI003CCEC9BE